MDKRYQINDPETVALLEEISEVVSRVLPKNWDYTLFVFSDGEEDSSLFYTSTTTRDENVSILKQWVDRNIQ